MDDEGRYVPGAGARWAMLGGALLLGWVAVRGAVQSTLQYAAPQVATRLWPADGVGLASLARLRVATASGDVDDTTRALYRAALAREPLLADPLVLDALNAAAGGDDARAERLMLAARDRDPRSSITRLWLFDHFMRTGDYPRALDEAGPSVRLRPDAITAIMTVLAAIAGTPEGRVALTAKLRERPFWRTAFFRTAAGSAPPDALAELLASLPRNPDRAAADQEQRAVFLALIAAGDGARAYRTWRQMLPAGYRDRGAGVYDGDFGRWPGAEPFNWMLTEDGTGTARMVRAGDLPQSSALDVRYFGSSAGVLAEQYTYVTPGSYRLQVSARQRSNGANGGRLGMEVRCGAGDIIATLPLDALGARLRSFAVPVAVQPGCETLRIRLVGTPGDLFSEIQAQVTGIALVPDS